MAGKLNARRVETLTEPGRYSDGGNLYLLITSNGGKRWTFLYRLGGKRREMGLGSAGQHGVSLKEARDKAAEARMLVAAGRDPLEVRAAEEKGPAYHSLLWSLCGRLREKPPPEIQET